MAEHGQAVTGINRLLNGRQKKKYQKSHNGDGSNGRRKPSAGAVDPPELAENQHGNGKNRDRRHIQKMLGERNESGLNTQGRHNLRDRCQLKGKPTYKKENDRADFPAFLPQQNAGRNPEDSGEPKFDVGQTEKNHTRAVKIQTNGKNKK